jgi:hypothetical protein
MLSCSKREMIKSEESDFIGFNFFLFAAVNGEDYHGSGDAAVVKSKIFKFRVYENLLNRHIFDFTAVGNGRIEMAVPSKKAVYSGEDSYLSKILTEYFYDFFKEIQGGIFEGDLIKSVFLEKNRLQSIILNYKESEVRIEVLKRFENGRPKRITIESGGNSLLFDIISFSNMDFTIDIEGFEIRKLSGGTLFDWLGAYDD